ncbi:hypothetical protein N9W62_03245 [Akkermansiaceae bacterium]|nr:hypothetical protein [Akkermansiaceae bacterium]
MSSKIKSKLPLYRRGKKNQISLRATFGGKQRSVSLRTVSVREAEELARKFIKTADMHSYELAREELYGRASAARVGDKVDFDQVKTLYEQFHDSQPDETTAEGTRKSYYAALKKMFDCANVTYLEDIDHYTLYGSWKSAFPSQTKATYIAEIRKSSALFTPKALAFFKHSGFSVVNPFAHVSLPKGKPKRYIPLQPRSLYTKITECEGLSDSQAMIVKLAALMGLRRGEIQLAQLSWVTDSERMFIPDYFDDWTPKGNEGRTLHVGTELIELLLSLRGGSSSKFLVPGSGTNLGDRLKPDLTFVCQWLRNLGINDRKPLHLLRKEAGSVIASNHKQTIFAAQEWLGHACVTTTQKHYAHLIETAPYNPLDYV